MPRKFQIYLEPRYAPRSRTAAWVMLDFSKSVFEQYTLLRKAMQMLLEEHPQTLCISVHGGREERAKSGQLAVYVAWLNGARLPQRKKKPQSKPLAASSFGVPGE